MFIKILLSLMVLFATPALADQWRGGTGENTLVGTTLFNDIDTVSYSNIVAPLDRLLAGYRKGMSLIYDSASQITVASGEVTVSNSDGSIRLMLQNTSNTTVTWSDIDTGAEASSTTYYIYAIAASSSATTATFKISASSTEPSGVTYYKRIGSFYNNSSSNIDQNKIYTEPYGFGMTDSSGMLLGQFAGVFDYGSSASSSTRRNPAGLYLAYGSVALSSGSLVVSGLPFTSATSYTVLVSLDTGAGTQSQGITVARTSASSFTVTDSQGTNKIVHFIAIGN